MTRAARSLGALAVIIALVATATVVVKASYGAFSDQYPLVGYFSRAGEGLHPGSEVQHDGVTVGQVGSISLKGGRAEVQVRIDHGFRVPSNVSAVINPKNVFGEEVVDLNFADGDTATPLAAGATLAHTSVSDQITEMLAAADPLLNRINGKDLATVIGELSVASQGEGPKVAQSFQEGAKLADLLSSTLGPQIQALQSFNGFTGALAPTGANLNAISANENLALPVFNAQAAAYQKALTAFTPVADELANYLSAYRPQIARLLTEGVNPTRVLIADKAYISQSIDGLYHYVYKFAKGASPETLSDGTKFAYFRIFVMFSDINNLVCGLLAPAQPGLSYLKPLQQLLAGAGTPLNCSSQFAAFNAAQASGTPSPSGVPQTAQQLSNQLGAIIGAPQVPATGSGNVGSFLNGLLGGGS